jgi:putative heme-binding domain-containing protein
MRLSPGAQNDLLEMAASDNPMLANASVMLAEKFAFQRTPLLESTLRKARGQALDSSLSASARVHSIGLLGLQGLPLGEFEDLISVQQPPEVQVAAARVLARSEDGAAMAILLDRWNSCTPEMRVIMENAFMRSGKQLSLFMNALSGGSADPALMSPAMRTRLSQHSDKSIRDKAKTLLAHLPGNSREEVITSYYESTILKGDRDKGKKVFRKTCSTCHQLEETGRAFGPDLLSVTGQTRINLLTMIVDPNNNIAPGYDGYLVETTNGRTVAGIMANETSSSVVIRTPEGEEEVIARDGIRSMRPLTQSLMPEGLEGGLSKQDVADLIEYLKSASH